MRYQLTIELIMFLSSSTEYSETAGESRYCSVFWWLLGDGGSQNKEANRGRGRRDLSACSSFTCTICTSLLFNCNLLLAHSYPHISRPHTFRICIEALLQQHSTALRTRICFTISSGAGTFGAVALRGGPKKRDPLPRRKQPGLQASSSNTFNSTAFRSTSPPTYHASASLLQLSGCSLRSPLLSIDSN